MDVLSVIPTGVKRSGGIPDIKRFLYIFIFVISACLPSSVSAARGSQVAPRLVNFYLDWRIKDEDQAPLAKWDLVVLDMDLQWQFPDRIRALRKANPGIKIIAYISSSELARARGQGDHASPGYHLASQIPEAYFMHGAGGQRLSWWPGADLLNATDVAARANGKRWNEFLPAFIHDELMSTGLWDGVFLDAAYGAVTPVFGKDIDTDSNGVANGASEVDQQWRTGMTHLLQNVRQSLGPNALVMSNSSAVYAGEVNGVLFENFPRYGWGVPMREFLGAIQKNDVPFISSLNTNTNNLDTAGDYRLMRYGLGSALLGNGYYSFDQGDQGHHRTWWYDEYEATLGAPRAAARRLTGEGNETVPGVWMRVYERGVAVVNTNKVAHRVTLPGTFEKLRGTQDRRTNDGSLVRVVDVPPQDSLILLGQADFTSLEEGTYTNGSFLRPYDANGTLIRQGFFADIPAVSQGSKTVLGQDSNGTRVSAVADRGRITVTRGSSKISFYPFGSFYRGGLSLAIGNTNSDAAPELIVGRDMSAPPEVKVFSLSGLLLARWTAYRASFQGGARVAIGDLDGDGRREIVTGAGPGGGPHIRLFKTDGQVWGGSFFAFPEREHGGVTVAVGDVDGDKKDEIVVGSGEGAIPRVRIFDFRGTLKKEMVLGTQPLLGGVSVSLADLNRDGKKEILVGGFSPF